MTDPSLSMSPSSKNTSLSLHSLAVRFMSTRDLHATFYIPDPVDYKLQAEVNCSALHFR